MAWRTERVWVTGEEFPYSTSQVNKAGDRIRHARAAGRGVADRDLNLLDFFRSSHYPALREVDGRLRWLFHDELGAPPKTVAITARPLKTPDAIIAKLVREKTRLGVIQDIAGTRIVVPTRDMQLIVSEAVQVSFSEWSPRVAKDTCDVADEDGYRGLHLIVTTEHVGVGKRLAEIQIRTTAQDAWAQVVETVDKNLRVDLKHGDGPADWREWLLEMSETVGAFERGEPFTIPPAPPLSP